MALNLLSAMPEHRTDSFLVIRYLKHLEIDCLDLAIACECEKFVSSLTIQNILDKRLKDRTYQYIFMGQFKTKNSFQTLSCSGPQNLQLLAISKVMFLSLYSDV